MQPTVLVHAYNRPRLLFRLLKDLEEQGAERVQVWDDCSDKDLSASREFVEARGWVWRRASEQHGKRLFWKWVSAAYEAQKSTETDSWVLLPDDIRLCQNFFSRCAEYWSACPRRTVSLNLLRDEARLSKPNWTGLRPTPLNDKVEEVGYTDGLALVSREYFSCLGWKLDPVPATRWARDPQLSSGVGMQVSTHLHSRGKKQCRVRQSLVQHVDGPSEMNPIVRLRDSMAAVDFVDGEEAASKLRRSAKVTASMASIPSRRRDLDRVVGSLSKQVDHLNVYLNGYSSIPNCLLQDWITVARSQDHGDRGDAGKVFWTDSVQGYHFLCDDDLVYPLDYVERLVCALEARGRQAVVGVHGRVLSKTIQSYYASASALYHCLRRVQEAQPVHVLGTGCLVYHTDTLTLTPEDFPEPNMADIWLAIAAQKQAVPRVVLSHSANWLVLTHTHQPDSIFDTYHQRDHRQTELVRDNAPWALLPDVLLADLDPAQRPPHLPPPEVFWDRKVKRRRTLASSHDAWDASAWVEQRKKLWAFFKKVWRFRGSSVLDFGCGTGRFSEYLAKEIGAYVGCDLSQQMLCHAESRFPELSFVKNTAATLPFSDNQFASLFVCETLQHIPDDLLPLVAKELRRVVRERGRVLILENTQRLRTRHDWERQLVYRTPLEYQQLFPGVTPRGSFDIEGEPYTLLAGSLV